MSYYQNRKFMHLLHEFKSIAFPEMERFLHSYREVVSTSPQKTKLNDVSPLKKRFGHLFIQQQQSLGRSANKPSIIPNRLSPIVSTITTPIVPTIVTPIVPTIAPTITTPIVPTIHEPIHISIHVQITPTRTLVDKILQSSQSQHLSTIEYSKTKGFDTFSAVVFDTLLDEFYTLSPEEKHRQLKRIKLDVFTLWNTQSHRCNLSFYEESPETVSRFFTDHVPLTASMCQIYAEALGFNLIYIDTTHIIHYTPFVANRPTVTLLESAHHIYGIRSSTTTVIQANQIQSLLPPLTLPLTESTLSVQKLPTLQQLVLSKGYPLKKQNPTGRWVNLTKEDLIRKLMTQ